MYRPLSILSIIYLFIYLFSCSPVNYSREVSTEEVIVTKPLEEKHNQIKKIDKKNTQQQNKIIENSKYKDLNIPLSKNIKVLISKREDPKIVRQFLDIIELAVYNRKIKEINFKIYQYDKKTELINYLNENIQPGDIFFGPIGNEDTLGLSEFCEDGALFFSFSSNKSLAGNCIFLINFFLHNEIETIFEYLPNNSKVAIIYPENSYGYKINEIADSVSQNSNSVIVNRASYKENLENVRSAIKELGKYELRKFELNRQKKLLALKKDEKSKQRLNKLERFTTTKDYDFTHVLIADYGIRLLQVAPLLAYYDIDPNIVRFIGTGAWDDEVFFNEPSLQKSIFPGVDYVKREGLVNDYNNFYDEELMRISTLPYDLVGFLAYLISNNYNLLDFYKMIADKNLLFDGVDGSFYFQNNLIERDLGILQIYDGKALKIN